MECSEEYVFILVLLFFLTLKFSHSRTIGWKDFPFLIDLQGNLTETDGTGYRCVYIFLYILYIFLIYIPTFLMVAVFFHYCYFIVILSSGV